MEIKKLFLSFIACFCLWMGASAARQVVTVDKITASLTLSEAVDYHITASEECIAEGVTVNLTHEDAWLFFDHIRPIDVQSKWLSKVKVNGNAIVAQSTAWVNIYKHGAVVIPYGKDYSPLTIYTGELYSDDSQSYSHGKFTSLGAFDNKIKSFKLKRGYMMTVAQSQDGSGYSRVFIAQDEDIEVPNLLDITNGGALYNKISYIRVMRWQMPAKKGAIDTDPDMTDCSWYYNYDASNGSRSDNLEYSNMWHHVAWNVGAIGGNVSNISGVTHTLGFNEPWNPADDGYMGTDPYAPIPYQYNLVKNGLRIGSMAATDGNVGKTIQFVKRCDELGLRIDFVAIHVYQFQSADWWYNYTKNIYNQTGRPVWITEWNNGANWTTESWPSDPAQAQEVQRKRVTEVINKLNEAPWVERYAIYNNVEDKRKIVMNGVLTPAGEAYKAHQPGIAFNPAYEFIPVYPTFTAPTVLVDTALLMNSDTLRIRIAEPNGEYYDQCVIEKKVGDGAYEMLVEGHTLPVYTDRWDWTNPQRTTYRFSFYYCNETVPRFTEETTVRPNLAQEGDSIRYGLASLSKPNYSYVMFQEFENSKAAMPVIGGMPRALLAGSENQFVYSLYPILNTDKFRMRLIPWGYLYDYDKTTLADMDYQDTVEVPYLVVDTAQHFLQDHPVEAGKVTGVGKDWVRVTFKKSFDERPVVFPVLLSDRNYSETRGTGYARVRNVTKESFEVRITREEKLSASAWPFLGEDVGYYAMERGTICIPNVSTRDTLNIVIEATEAEVGSITSTKTTVFPKGSCPAGVTPTMISALQSSNDEYTSALVYSSLSSGSVKFYKVREHSTSLSHIADKDQVGYVLISTSPYIDSGKEEAVLELKGKIKHILDEMEGFNEVDVPKSIWNELQEAQRNGYEAYKNSNDIDLLTQIVIGLTEMIELTEKGIELQFELSDLMEQSQITLEQYTNYPGHAAYTEEISKVSAIFENAEAGISHFEQMIADLEKATRTFLLSGFELGAIDRPFDATWVITNPDFEQGSTGWDTPWETLDTGDNYPGFGHVFLEKHVNAADSLDDFSFSQTLHDVPNGLYILSAWMIATRQNTSELAVNGVYLYGNEGTTEVSTQNGIPQLFTVEVRVTENTLTLGAKTEGTRANWVAVDNLTLSYLGMSEVGIKDPLAAEIQIAKDLLATEAEKIMGVEKELANEAILQGESAHSVDEILQAHSAVVAANEALRACIVAYHALLPTLVEAEQLSTSEAYSQVDLNEFKNVLARQMKVLTAPFTRGSDLAEVEETLSAAIRTLKFSVLKEATLTNPIDATWVITNPDFEEGPTGWDTPWETLDTGDNYPGFGHVFLEKYVNSANSLDDFSFSQTLHDIPNGLYILSAWMIATRQNTSELAVNGVYLYGNEGTTEVSTQNGIPQLFTLEVRVTENTLTLGAKTEGTRANWVAVDNLTLSYLGMSEVGIKDPLAAEIQIAKDLLAAEAEKIMGVEKELANEAILQGESARSVDEILQAHSAVVAANEALRVCIVAYHALLPTLVEAEQLSTSEAYPQVDLNEFENVLARQMNVLTAPSTRGSDLAEVEETLSAAIRTLKLSALKDATLKDPVDATWLIVNPDFDTDTMTGWTCLEEMTAINHNGVEFFEEIFYFYQEIKDIPNGTYDLSVQGFQRTTPNDSGDAYKEGTEEITACLYANDDFTPLVSLYSEPTSSLEGISGLLNGYPNNMQGAQEAFAKGLYKVEKLTFSVRDNAITLGVRNAISNAFGWGCFDHFTLIYRGDGGGVNVEEINTEPFSLQAYSENGYIKVANAEYFTVTTLSGSTVDPNKSLASGIYIVKAHGATTKVMIP